MDNPAQATAVVGALALAGVLDRFPGLRLCVVHGGGFLPYQAERLDTCFVIDKRRVVLGRLGRRAILGREDVTAEQAMTLGPSTIRPSARLREVVERMQRQKLTSLPVTTSDGRLIGLQLREDAERAVAAASES